MASIGRFGSGIIRWEWSQVFVANPNKPRPILDILLRNQEKLVDFLTKFHTDRAEDEQFNDEKAYLIKQIKELRPVAEWVRSCKNKKNIIYPPLLYVWLEMNSALFYALALFWLGLSVLSKQRQDNNNLKKWKVVKFLWFQCFVFVERKSSYPLEPTYPIYDMTCKQTYILRAIMACKIW